LDVLNDFPVLVSLLFIAMLVLSGLKDDERDFLPDISLSTDSLCLHLLATVLRLKAPGDFDLLSDLRLSCPEE